MLRPIILRPIILRKVNILSNLVADLPNGLLLIAIAVTLFAGFVKGAVGFAMPMIMVSAFSSFLPPETALAGLILPTLISNVCWRASPAYGLVFLQLFTFDELARLAEALQVPTAAAGAKDLPQRSA